MQTHMNTCVKKKNHYVSVLFLFFLDDGVVMGTQATPVPSTPNSVTAPSQPGPLGPPLDTPDPPPGTDFHIDVKLH